MKVFRQPIGFFLAAISLPLLAGCVEGAGPAPGMAPPVLQSTYIDPTPFMRQTQPAQMQPVYSATTCRPIYGGGFQCM